MEKFMVEVKVEEMATAGDVLPSRAQIAHSLQEAIHNMMPFRAASNSYTVETARVLED